jgi:S-adenosylmethionine:tRNA ribosyltransferase-isomerase
MRVDLFDFHLPPERIAHHPVTPRDAAKLLHVTPTAMHDRIVRDVVDLLSPGDIVVFNNSRVIPARLFTQVNEKQIEILLHQPIPGGASQWHAFAKPARKLKPGMQLTFAADFTAIVDGRTEDGQVILRFPYNQEQLFEKLRAHGHMPLPPYITRGDAAEDTERYQTVYAAADGSVAAPTAGLHFTSELLEKLNACGAATAFVTLHVGAGTFQPVKVDDTADHTMHREWCEISAEAAEAINAARANGGKVIAVGTTSLRILESFAADDGTLGPHQGETGIFITPGYRFKIIDRLITNFHLPKSTLFMLVSAFAGLNTMQAAYAHAIANNYRFYSYGDASLLERAS